ncbi:MAG: ABC transporter substrate-binding protein [Beijerinckiaceae bacterium]
MAVAFSSGFAGSEEIVAPRRIASVNLCADQLLLALAPAEKIAALGPFARDPALSFLAQIADRFPQLNGRSEELLRVKADAVAVGPFDNKFMRASLGRRDIVEIVVDRWTSLREVRRGVEVFARQIGEPAKGAVLLGEIDSALREFRGGGPPAGLVSFLILHRRGFVGQGGLVSEILETAGLRDVAKTASARFMGAEDVIALRPDFLVVTERHFKAEDRGQELLEHPALRSLYPDSRRLIAPDRLTICAGPSTPALVRALKSELDQKLTRQ